ncbi:MAG: hypothetical protein WC366_04040 [Bacilli bacterium]
MNLELHNILVFDDFKINFSYPKKLVKTSIENEYLKGHPNFRYKKLNIFIGSNATGKTSIGMAIWDILSLFTFKNPSRLCRDIAYGKNNASFSIDFVENKTNVGKNVLHRISGKIGKTNKDAGSFDGSVLLAHQEVALKKDDSYESAIKSFSNNVQFDDFSIVLKDFSMAGWRINLPITETGFDKVDVDLPLKARDKFVICLESVLRTLDPSIQRVFLSQEAKNGYVVQLENDCRVVVEDGRLLSSIPYLSSGTKCGFNIAHTIFSMKHCLNGFYYIDEQFTYINSEIECAVLALMVSMLDDCEQLFFTTHNNELLSMPYPLHSYWFLRREFKNGNHSIEYKNGSDDEKRNNVSVRNMYDNDYFLTYPDLSRIYSLGKQH